MNKDEEYVRSVWRNVIGYPNRTSCTVVILTGSDAEDVYSSDFERTTKESAWSAAAEFTRERQEQVRQVREEIDDIDNYASPQALRKWMEIEAPKVNEEYVRNYATGYARRNRTLARLEAELTRLTASMKPEAIA